MTHVQSLLNRGRAAAQALMTDTCRVRRAGAASTDSSTGVVTPSWTYPYATGSTAGPCRVQDSTGSTTGAVGGVAQSDIAAVVVSLPMSATGIVPGDQVVVVSCAHDPGLVGRVFTVTRVLAKSHATARRLWCEEVQA